MILLFSCGQAIKQESKLTEPFQPEEILVIDHQLNAFPWIGNPYKHSQFVADSILVKEGPQSAATSFSFIGEHAKVLSTWDELFPENLDTLIKEDQKSVDTKAPVPAIPYILSRADTHEIVILNEAHHIAEHRVFARRLLQGLYDLGYRHLGMEAYYSNPRQDSLLDVRGHPELKNGIYTVEPQFGNMIREAHALGFKLFGYEEPGTGSQIARETGQAQNIKKYMDANSEGKVFIYCGYSHGTEGDLDNDWEKAMAQRLKDMTNVDPLTINQTTYREASTPDKENKFYKYLDPKFSTVYTDQSGNDTKAGHSWGRYKTGSFDVTVFHPRTNYSKGRPTWLVDDEYELISFDLSSSEIAYPAMVLAYRATDELSDAVPIDVQEAEDGEVHLVLPSGKMKIIVTGSDGISKVFDYGEEK